VVTSPRLVEVELEPDRALDPSFVSAQLARAAGADPDAVHVEIRRRTIDARRRRVRIRFQGAVHATAPVPEPPPDLLQLRGTRGEARVVVIGSGPAGLFAALACARAGIPTLLLDRGQPVSQRRRDVADLSARGTLHLDSNYCFGEGGAGTFSDGKLYSRSDKRGEGREVLRVLVACGAPPDILVDARPHIGTNRLPGVVTRLREQLEAGGVQVAWGAKVVDLIVRDGRVAGVTLADGAVVPARAVVVATGHSARDVLELLRRRAVALTFKPFALGVRIEHPQELVDRRQYGALAGHPALGAASYRLVEQCAGTSVFSFCMCPGGHVAPATTEADAVVVNGWSSSSRRGRFANSGFVTPVAERELAALGLDPADPLAGLAFQARFEQAAWSAGGGAFVAPAQRLQDLVVGRPSTSLPACSYPRGIQPARLDLLLGHLAGPIVAALRRLGARMPELLGPEGIALGVESRTSCPVRVLRDGTSLASPSLAGLYPCGEGAGYAGGILSAALDGLRVGRRVAEAHLAG
jgi:hypothetical protein